MPPSQSDQRQCQRFNIEVPASVFFVGGQEVLNAQVIDVSRQGCRIRIPRKVATRDGARAEVSFRLNGVAFRLAGQQQWDDGWNRMGLSFAELSPWRAEHFDEVIAELQEDASCSDSATGVEGELSTAKDTAEPELNFERSEEPCGVLQSLTQESEELSPSARRAIHLVPDPAKGLQKGAASTPFTGPERRRHRRYELEASATISLVMNGAQLSGSLLDLSTHGCRIATDARFPAGLRQRVEVRFVVEGLSFLIPGSVKAVEERIQIGIEFAALSERKRLQLAQLIEEIEAKQHRALLA